MAAVPGRNTRRYQQNRAALLAISDVCWLCGHAGAGSADHEPPLKELRRLGLDPDDMRYMRPAHGALSRCPTCGRCCNEAKGAREPERRVVHSRAW